MEYLVEQCLELLIPLCELIGIFVVGVSAVSSFGSYVKGMATHRDSDVKGRLASGLGLSLEFKMAAEILKTVVVRDFGELAVLGTVIVLRALLSLLIHLEMKH